MDNKRRKVRSRSNYRSFKEGDLILGGFAKEHMRELIDSDIDLFEKLLKCKDQDIYGWITGKTVTPEEYDTDLFKRIKNFKPLK